MRSCGAEARSEQLGSSDPTEKSDTIVLVGLTMPTGFFLVSVVVGSPLENTCPSCRTYIEKKGFSSVLAFLGKHEECPLLALSLRNTGRSKIQGRRRRRRKRKDYVSSSSIALEKLDPPRWPDAGRKGVARAREESTRRTKEDEREEEREEW